MRKIYPFLLFIICVSGTGYSQVTQEMKEVIASHEENAKAQELAEILKLHRTNLGDLYMSRGGAPSWAVTGEVNESNIMHALRILEGSGLLVYTWLNGNLDVRLFGPEGVVYSRSQAYEKEELVQLIRTATSYIPVSSGNSLRGSKVLVSKAEHGKFRKAFEQVNQVLLPPPEMLREFNHLIIVPTLNIGNLAFAAFRLENDFLVDHLSYSIAPSLPEFLALNHINQNKNIDTAFFRNALLVTNPNFSLYKNENFDALPGTVTEGETLTRLLEKNQYLHLQKNEVTKDRILREVCGRDLLYFATHGVASPTDPLVGSYLVVTGKDKADFLTAKEIQEIRNNCRLEALLVVLSACQTGLGQEHEAGTIGLARAFQIAGAGQVLMSLWNIDDSQTSVLMQFFMEELKMRGKSATHTALQAAVRRYKTDVNEDPRYWASFSLFGIPY